MRTMDLRYFSKVAMLKRFVDWLESGEKTEAELLAMCLERIREADSKIQAWVVVAPQKALGRGPLRGIPFGVKDIYETENLATEFGSPVYRGRKGTRDAALVRDLRERGAVVLGKTHTAAFALRDPAPTRNPRDTEHTPGGSSSGSAAAVAAGMVPFALGTQTLGSVLRPASFCGVVGFKPTHGLLPAEGVLPVSKSLDTPGLFTQTVEDMRLLWQRMGFPAGQKETVRLGVPEPLPEVDPEMEKEFRKSVTRLRAGGFSVENVKLPPVFSELRAAARVVEFYEGARAHEQRWREHGEKLGALAELVREGLRIPAEEYTAALENIARAKKAMTEVFATTPVILTPSAVGPAPRGLSSTGDPRMNAPWTALGVPAISVPMPVAAGLPLGLQLTADSGHEARLLEAAFQAEQRLKS
jgi:Asp-tRNA(Asn)/Glu-tRNA(Gln) amidotransferase A subunit family amidase